MGTVREALYECLGRQLQADGVGRNEAESQLKALQVVPDYPLFMLEWTLDVSQSSGLRSLCSVLLRQHVEHRWSRDCDKFVEPIIDDVVKQELRAKLMLGLFDSSISNDIKSNMASIYAFVAQNDWPNVWPIALQPLVDSLQDAQRIQIGVRVLKELCRELGSHQVLLVCESVVPDLYLVIASSSHPTLIRARCIEILATLITLASSIVERKEAKALVNTLLPPFLDILLKILRDQQSHYAVRIEAVKALTSVVRCEPKAMSQQLDHVVHPIWQNLMACAQSFSCTRVHGQNDAEDECVDSDGEVVGLDNLLFALFDFIANLFDVGNKCKNALRSAGTDILYYLLIFMQITQEQGERWLESIDSFVEDEGELTFNYSVRVSAQELFTSFGDEFGWDCIPAFNEVVHRHLSECGDFKYIDNSRQSWKIVEAIMLALEKNATILNNNTEGNKGDCGSPAMDIKGLIENVALPNINHSAPPLLAGRCLRASAKYASHLSPSLLTTVLEACSQGLNSQVAVVRISSLIALKDVSSVITNHDNDSSISARQRTALQSVVNSLLCQVQFFQGNPEMLALILDIFVNVIKADVEVAREHEGRLTPVIFNIFLEKIDDPSVTAVCEEALKCLSGDPSLSSDIQCKLVPTLLTILQRADEKALEMKSSCLDLITALLRGCSKSQLPLSDVMVCSGFFVVAKTTATSNDNAIMQSGGECVRAFVSVASGQLTSVSDSENKSALYYCVQVAVHLLNPTSSEFTATFVGRLVTTLISKCGNQLGENLDMLLRAVLSKLQGSGTLSVIQSLLMVFAQLMQTQLEAVLNFLVTMPGPSGQTALQFVLQEWLTRQAEFYGSYETAVSLTALGKLLKHVVATNFGCGLSNIYVKGDLIARAEGRTRAQKAQQQDSYTSVPVLAKIVKLMLHELHVHIEELRAHLANRSQNEDEDDDDSDEESDEESSDNFSKSSPQKSNTTKGIELSTLLDPKIKESSFFAEDDDEDEEDEDPDIINDPLYHLNMRTFLISFLQELSQQPYFYSHFAPFLNTTEKHTLKDVGIECP